MIVTINTDASFSPSEKRGSFAFWIVSNSGRVATSGMLRKKVLTPSEAEFQCIINAIHTLVNQNWKNIDKIIINTDCLNVIHLIKNNQKAIKRYGLRKWGKYLVDKFTNIVYKSSLRKVPIEFRHIKAHVSTETTKQYVNDWCDKEAKKQLYNFHKLNIKEHVRNRSTTPGTTSGTA